MNFNSAVGHVNEIKEKIRKARGEGDVEESNLLTVMYIGYITCLRDLGLLSSKDYLDSLDEKI